MKDVLDGNRCALCGRVGCPGGCQKLMPPVCPRCLNPHCAGTCK